jgi:hypothetical protein
MCLFKDIKIMVWTDFLKSRAPIGLPKIEIEFHSAIHLCTEGYELSSKGRNRAAGAIRGGIE